MNWIKNKIIKMLGGITPEELIKEKEKSFQEGKSEGYSGTIKRYMHVLCT